MEIIKAIIRVFTQKIIIGRLYQFRDCSDPFQHQHWIVKVKDIKKGYVQYERTWTTKSNPFFLDSINKSSFNFCYKLINKEDSNEL